ncbi:MAG TPA: histidinol-phosphate transaminase [Gemmatimonadaceae bacterium]
MTTSNTNPRASLELGRASFRNLSAYDPDIQPCRIDLSDNTNLWGAPPAARSAVEFADSPTLTRYPAPYSPELTRALAGYLGVDANMVIAGCGSDDLLDSAIRAFGEAGDKLAHFDPTFGMIRVFATVNGLSVTAVPARNGEGVEALLGADARVIYLCSPNNPTGEVLDSVLIESIVRHAQGLVILDEAYAEFAGVSSVGLLARHENLLITRTMSKAFGLAGLRIGYAAGSPAIVREVEKSRGPYKVTSFAERAARAAIEHDREWVEEKVAEVRTNRARFTERLRGLGLEPIESSANFILVPVVDSRHTGARMARSGVAVRQLENLTGIGDSLRISIGPWPMMEECLAVLEAALQ